MEQSRIQAYFQEPARQKQLVALLARLVAVKSVKGESAPDAPFGPGPRAALDVALDICRELGLATGHDDYYVGTADLNDKDTQLHILAHLDVVGEGSGWATDPYTLVEQDGLVFGRGVSDDKGPAVAAMLAMKAVNDLGGVPKNVRLILGTDEESGSADIAHYYASHPYAPYSFTPDADFPVIHIEKGHYHPDFGAQWEEVGVLPRVTTLQGGFRANVVPPEASCLILGLNVDDVAPMAEAVGQETAARFTVTPTEGGSLVHCQGKNAHAAGPGDGINAIQALLTLLARLPLASCPSTDAIHGMHALFPFGDWLGKGLGIAQSHPESHDLTLNLALMELSDRGFSAKFDVRFPLCATEENCKNVCEANLAKYGFHVMGDPDMVPAHCVPAGSPLVRTLLRCYSLYTGEKDPQPIAIGGGTYVHDIPGGVAFGCDFPGFDPKMHAANEQAKVDNLLLSAQIFTQAIFDLCGE